MSSLSAYGALLIGSPIPASVEWGVAGRMLSGQTDSGDLAVIQPFGNGDGAAEPGGVLLAGIDGLGHGEEAAEAARTAGFILMEHAHESVISLVRRCHARLGKTRGVVMSVASLDTRAETLTWIGVGNVDGALLHRESAERMRRESIMLRGGVVGFELPPLRAAVLPVVSGDVLILTTDGVCAGFVEDRCLTEPAQSVAERILAQYGKDSDDALVLVARYLGSS